MLRGRREWALRPQKGERKMTATEHIRAALVAVRRERARLEARIKQQTPAIKDIAEHGETAEARELATRWLALA